MNLADDIYSCEGCIWHGQCVGDNPCDDYDNGTLNTELPSESEIEIQIKIRRKEYHEDFRKYTDLDHIEKYDFFSIQTVDELRKVEKCYE